MSRPTLPSASTASTASTATAGAVADGGALERVEILRATLRWASKLERPQIEQMLAQCNRLRQDVLTMLRARVSGVGRDDTVELEPLRRPARKKRRALKIDVDAVFGDSPALRRALDLAERAAPTDLAVLIGGESGTGKELMAKLVHSNSRRADKPFVSVNCGAIPDNLLESELFGHKKGAFTGAVSDRQGRFEAANGGTLFLDEIGELPLPGQVKLLRALQSQEIQRVGSDRELPVDVRVVAATNRDLRAMVADGAFREDLYYRLGVIDIELPALRDRADEIPLLIDFYTAAACGELGRSAPALTPRLKDFLLNYRYPGNIRELRNLIYRLMCLADERADLPLLPNTVVDRPADGAPAGGAYADDAADDLPKDFSKASLIETRKRAADAAEKRFLQRALNHFGGRVIDVARASGMNRSHLQNLMKKHRMSATDFRPGGPAA